MLYGHWSGIHLPGCTGTSMYNLYTMLLLCSVLQQSLRTAKLLAMCWRYKHAVMHDTVSKSPTIDWQGLPISQCVIKVPMASPSSAPGAG